MEQPRKELNGIWYYSIGQAAKITGRDAQTLKWWEKHLESIDPVKVQFARKVTRYYTQELIELLIKVNRLRREGLSIEGIQRLELKGELV